MDWWPRKNRHTVQACRDGVSKARAHLHLIWDVEGKMISTEAEGRQLEMHTHCWTWQGTWQQRTLKRLKHSMPSSPWSLRVKFRYLTPAGKSGESKTYTWRSRKDQVRNHLNKLELPKIHGTWWVAPTTAEELVHVINRPFWNYLESLCWLGEVSESWKNVKITLLFNNRTEEDLGNYRPMDLSLIPGRAAEEIFLQIISTHKGHKDF